MDAVLAPLSLRRRFRKRFWGYRCGDVDAYVDEVISTNGRIREEIDRLRADADPMTRLSSDIASVLQSLTDAVAETRERAEEDAERLRRDAVAMFADAEASAKILREEAAREADRRVSSVFVEACTRFAAVKEHRDTASDAVTRAVDALQAAMVALADVPAVPPALGTELVSID